jgi:DNA repair exonuclease SbcCD nuclease subunit
MADAHLGRPFSGLTRSLPERAELFRRACYRAWDGIVETAIREGVDFLTIGGDTFDRSNPGLRPRVAFREGVKRLREAGIPVLMVTGNHDPLNDFPEDLKGLPGLHLFGPEPEARRMILRRSGPTVNVYGAGFERSSVRENLVEKFPRDPGGDFSIGLVHANVSGSSGHEDYAPCGLDDLKRGGMDIWCLGHVHRPRVLCEDPLVIYPGTLQGTHAKETGPHGCCLVEADDRAAAHATFIPAAPVRWEEVVIHITAISSPEEFPEAAAAACSEILAGDDTVEALIVRIVLRGERSVSAEDWRRGEGEILEVLGERLSLLSVPVFLESIRDGTEPSADLDSLMREDNFLSEFFEVTGEAATDPGFRGELVAVLDEELSRYGLRRFLDPDRDPRALLEDEEAFERALRDVRELVASEFLRCAGRYNAGT